MSYADHPPTFAFFENVSTLGEGLPAAASFAELILTLPAPPARDPMPPAQGLALELSGLIAVLSLVIWAYAAARLLPSRKQRAVLGQRYSVVAAAAMSRMRWIIARSPLDRCADK